jgi:hypothetical protein
VASIKLPPLSSIVRCDVMLPELQGSNGKPERFVLQAVGRVVRVKFSNTIGFGVSSRVSLFV